MTKMQGINSLVLDILNLKTYLPASTKMAASRLPVEDSKEEACAEVVHNCQRPETDDDF